MEYKCEECGHIFEEGEEATWTEPHGEKLKGCPLCYGAYIKAKRCEICEEILSEGEEKFCNNCKTIYENQFRRLIKEKYNDTEMELLKILFLDEEKEI